MLRTTSPSRAALLLLSAGLVVTSCLVGGWLWVNLGQTIERRTATRIALLRWQHVFSHLKDAESGARGYLITNDPRYMAPFEQARDLLPRLLMEATAAERALEDGMPTAAIEEIQRRLHACLGSTERTITVTQREGSARATLLFKDGETNGHMERLQALLDQRLSELDLRLHTLDSQMQNALATGGRGLLALATASLMATGAAGVMFRQALAQARRNERLALDKQNADRANREKSVFLATMSHEIRTPMNAILGFGELILADARDDRQKRYATSIVRGGQALLQLINDILDFSKIEAGMIDFAPEPMDVRELADFTRQLFAHQCGEKGVALRIEVEEGIPGSLLVDGARLRQIVINLVGNAIKFTSSGTVWLRFRGRCEVGAGPVCPLTIEVSDTGPGIPADRLEQIFDPFVQATVSREAALKGTGLGLAIVKRLTSLMGGTISVRSEVGRGSTFTVELPNVEVSARLAPQPGSTRQVAVDFNDLRPSALLVVDDNPENLSLVFGYFEATHHTIATAANGQAALEYLSRSERPDIVLMDIRMPVMDGRTALVEIRKRKELKLLPIIAVTASSLAHEERELRKSFDGFVRKPFSRAQLFAALAQFIPRHVQGTAPAVEERAPAPAAWGPLVRQLRDLQHSTWPAVQDGMVMSEVRQFAADLRRLALDADCPPLEKWAARLLDGVESFSLEAMETGLAEFPGLVARLEKRTGTPQP